MSDLSKQVAPIPDYEGLYWASKSGAIYSKNKTLKHCVDAGGYACVKLSKNGKTKSYRVHRLILLAFVGPRPNGYECCHGNGVKLDNRLENLRWDTKSANSHDKRLHGSALGARGEKHPRAKLTSAQIKAIKNDNRTLRSIASEYGVHCTTILAVKQGRTWEHLAL